MQKVTRRYIIVTFIIMALAWGTILIAQQYNMLHNESPLFFPLYIMGGASTTIASFVVLTLEGTTIKEWFKNVFGIKQKPQYYAIMLFYIVLFVALGFITKSFSRTMPIWYLFIYSLTNIVEGGLEEAGWRYILQPNLEKKMGFIWATLITSMVWTIWHLPLFYIKGTAQNNMSFWLFFIFFIGYSFALATIRKLTNSVWLCVLFHSALNACLTVFAVEFSLIRNLIITVVVSVVSILLVHKSKMRNI